MRKLIGIVAAMCCLWAPAQTVNMEHNVEKIPTYKLGAPEIDPIFFTGRVYQGAEGYIYPYPLFDVLTDTIIEQEYDVLRLNNEYVDISVLPEIGGRIFRAQDKGNKYPFFYTQTGVKPALIGMLGAWLSGGVEWNVPDHHRATSYMPVNYTLSENADGSKTIWVGESELRHRLKWSVGVTVYPERSWVQARVVVNNPTSMIQSMLYWANVSVHCGEDYQVIFPPDVNVGVDHHKVYFTRWPEGPMTPRGEKIGDQSWWKNFTEGSRSIFAWGSDMEFLAGYDYGKDAGTVHVANRHQVPGKKFFLWGNNPNGHMWNKILSDNDGHYLELMVGAYSDNQPDYSWIAPGEVREFSQIWFPIKGIKGVKNATIEGAVNFEPANADGSKYLLGFNTTTMRKNAKVVVKNGDAVVYEKTIDIDPDNFFLETIKVGKVDDPTLLNAALYDAEGNLLVDFTPIVLDNDAPLPPVIDGTKPVEEYETVEELYLAGLRVDQFNNARLKYMDFYNEALKRDSMDARVNIEVGKHYLRQGQFDLAEMHLQRAVKRLGHDYTRLKDTEPQYYLGTLYALLGNDKLAADNFWAATWTPSFKHRSYYEIANIEARAGNYEQALKAIDESLSVGSRDMQALALKAYILRKLGRIDEAKQVIAQAQSIDPLDYWSAAEASVIDGNIAGFITDPTNHNNKGLVACQEILEIANNYLLAGDVEQALALLKAAQGVGAPFSTYAQIEYYIAYCYNLLGNAAEAKAAIDKAAQMNQINQYPLRIEEIALFNDLIAAAPDDAMLRYNLGNLLYYLGQRDKALDSWLKATELNPNHATSLRNVAFAYGQLGDLDNAVLYYNRAVAANPNDALQLTERDKICQQAKISDEERLKMLEDNMATVMRHDDAVMRLLTLYNATGQFEKAIQILDNRHFHLWEGGGEVHGIYADSHLLYAMELMNADEYQKAIEQCKLANEYPANLEVAVPAHGGAYSVKAYTLIAQCYQALGDKKKANEYYKKAVDANVTGWMSDGRAYQVMALNALGKKADAQKASEEMWKGIDAAKARMMDSYAKFGDSDSAAVQSRLDYMTGMAYLADGDTDKARDSFSSAVNLNPSNLWARYMLTSLIKR